MADAEFTFKATGAETVVAANNRIEQSMQQQAKASSKSGYAILEASRALEDFSMAGMRGALNNIPQLLMNLGVGAGLTGVIGALTIVVWKGTEALEAYFDKMNKMVDASAALGVSMFNREDIEQAFSKEAIDRAKEMNKVFADIAVSMEYLGVLTQRYFDEKESEQSLDFAKQMLELTQKRASEDEKAQAQLQNRIRLEKVQVEVAKDNVNTLDQEIANLKDLKKQQEDQLPLVNDIDLDEIDRMANQKYADIANEMLARPNFKDVLEGESYVTRDVPRTAEENIKLFEEATKAANKWKEEQIGLSNKQIEKSIQESLVAKEKIKLIDEEIKKKEDSLKIAKEQEESAKITSDLKIKELTILEDIAATERRQKKEDEDKKKAEAQRKAALMAERGIDVSAFLSSQARVGLGGNEAKVAMDTLSVSKQQLAQLKEIARNTKYAKKTVYN